MRDKKSSRRSFMKEGVLLGFSLGLTNFAYSLSALGYQYKKTISVGVIGLDTSHSTAFIKMLNDENSDTVYSGFRITAAYPKGSEKIENSASKIEAYTKIAREYKVDIVSSIKELLSKVDVILLESNDGTIRLDQASEVLRAKKPLFIDKPIAANLKDVIAIYDLAEKLNVPIFSSSSLRYFQNASILKSPELGAIKGADTYSPATLQSLHSDYFWYGIHGIEMLYTIMGIGCKAVTTLSTNDTDIVTGVWNDGRIGVFRGLRSGKKGYGGTIYGEKQIVNVVSPKNGYTNLLIEIITFFKTGIAPVNSKDTLEIYAFMEAAAQSKKKKGAKVELDEVYQLKK